MERNPWWATVTGPFPAWTGPSPGCKPDGGGCHRAQGSVGKRAAWEAAHRRDAAALKDLAAAQPSAIREVEAAGNTVLHAAAYGGWVEGVKLLLELGAKIDASNNAGDRAWHWADNMGQAEVKAALEASGADTSPGPVLVQDHVPKVKDFFAKACWAHHPKPYGDWLAEKRAKEAELDAEEAAGRIAGL